MVHFNEVDEGAGVDALITNRVWCQMGFSPETTLHDVRYGEWYKGDGVDDFVWVFLISGAAPPPISLTDIKVRIAGGSRPSISRWVAAPCVVSPNRVRSSGAGFMLKVAA